MGKKEIEKITKKLDEEAYYRWIIERDKKLSSRFSFLSAENIKRAFLFWLHMTGMHLFDEEFAREIGDKYYKFYKCKVCGHVCTQMGKSWEMKKYLLVSLAILLSLFIPIPTWLFYAKVSLWCFFFFTHFGVGLYRFIEG